MTAKISKWGNSAAIRLPKEIMDALALHVGDKIEISQQNNRVVITHVNEKNARLVEEAKRIKAHAQREYELLEGSLEDGLDAV